jgi:uncharacterized protein YkwD
MNWIDFCLLLILFYFGYRGFVIGFVASLLNLLSSVLSVLIAFRFYTDVGFFFQNSLGASKLIAPVLGFFAVILLAQILLSFVFSSVYKLVFKLFEFLKPLMIVDRVLGIGVQLVLGAVLITLALIVFLRLPLATDIKKDITDSYFGREILPQSVVVEPQIRQLLGAIPQETLLYLIPKKPDSEESITMNFPTLTESDLKDDPQAAQDMLILVNQERTSRGVRALTWDESIVPTARANSYDMFKRSYFSHINPDGKSPFDRMTDGGVQYLLAGENLAYAPSVEVAHKGLMNSPGHKENILRPEFGRIGIGVVDGGIYGKMFTQNFAD